MALRRVPCRRLLTASRVIFLIIAIPDVLLDVVVGKLEPYYISAIIIYGLKGTEYALFGTDLWLLGVFLLHPHSIASATTTDCGIRGRRAP